MLKAILFDHDGTIVDSERPHYEMWRDILRDYNINLSYAEYNRNYAGVPTPRLSQVFKDEYALNIDPKTLYNAKMDATNLYLAKQAYPLMDGALEAMQFFHAQGLGIAVVTGSAREGVNSTVEKHGLGQYVSAVVSRDDVAHTKPAPDCYLLAAQRLGVQPAACMAIEDTYSGSLAADGAGIKCVGVSAVAAIRNKFTTTVQVCSCLDEARTWILENYLS